MSRDRKEIEPLSPRELTDPQRCGIHMSRRLARPFLEMGVLNQTKAVGLYIASGVIEFARIGKPFMESEASIARALGIKAVRVRDAVCDLVKNGVVTRSGKNGDRLQHRRWSLPRLDPSEMATVGNSDGYPSGKATVTVGNSDGATVGNSDGHLRNSGSEKVRGRKKEEEGGRPTASRTSSSSATADKTEEKRPGAAKAAQPRAPLTEEAAQAAVSAALGGRSILTPTGLVDAFAALKAACGRDYAASERDEKVSPQVLKGVQSSAEDFAAWLASLAAKGELPPYLSGLSDLWAARGRAAAKAAEDAEAERVRALQAYKEAQQDAERLRWLGACKDPVLARIAAVAAGLPEAERVNLAARLKELTLSRRASLLGEPVALAAEAHGPREGLIDVVQKTFWAIADEHEARQRAAWKAAEDRARAEMEAKANAWQADWDRRQAAKAAGEEF